MLIILIIIFNERSCPSSDNNDKETKVQGLFWTRPLEKKYGPINSTLIIIIIMFTIIIIIIIINK